MKFLSVFLMFVVLAYVSAQMPFRPSESVQDQPAGVTGYKTGREDHLKANEKNIKPGNKDHGKASPYDRMPKTNPKKADKQQGKEKIVHRPKMPETKL